MTPPFFYNVNTESSGRESGGTPTGVFYMEENMAIFLSRPTESSLINWISDAFGLLAIVGLVVVIYIWGIALGFAP
jgi:hypothetical protein